jgi:hypothetical protein
MFRILVALALLIPFMAGGCTFQANNASQAVDFNPLVIGSGQAVFSPANGPGYVNGEAQDMRRR